MITIFKSEALNTSAGKWNIMNSQQRRQVVKQILRNRGDNRSFRQATLMDRGVPHFVIWRMVDDLVQT